MKKVLIALALIAASMAPSFARVSVADLNYGVKVFGNLNTVRGGWSRVVKGLNNSLSAPGFGVGGFAVLPLPQFVDGLGVRGEFLAQRFSEMFYIDDTYAGNIRESWNVAEFQIPIMLQYTFPANKLTLMAGPEIGLIFSGNHKLSSKSGTDKYKIGSDMYNPLQFGIGLGAQYKFLPDVFVDLRYSIGLSNLWKLSSDTKMGHARCLSLGFGYEF